MVQRRRGEQARPRGEQGARADRHQAVGRLLTAGARSRRRRSHSRGGGDRRRDVLRWTVGWPTSTTQVGGVSSLGQRLEVGEGKPDGGRDGVAGPAKRRRKRGGRPRRARCRLARRNASAGPAMSSSSECGAITNRRSIWSRWQDHGRCPEVTESCRPVARRPDIGTSQLRSGSRSGDDFHASTDAHGGWVCSPSRSPASRRPGTQVVSPGDDFFAYANGGWLAATGLPPGKDRWTARNEINELARRQVARLLDDAAAAPAGSLARKVADFRAAWLDTAAIEAKGIPPLEPLLDSIDLLRDKAALTRLPRAAASSPTSTRSTGASTARPTCWVSRSSPASRASRPPWPSCCRAGSACRTGRTT